MMEVELQQPIVAAVNGDAIGLGSSIAFSADIIVASERARFADTHVKIGVVAGDAYLIWWCFQLLGFAQRERFKGAGSPWWVLLPFGNLLYISRAFKGVADGGAARLGRASFSVGLANLGLISMLILSRVAANIYGMTGLALDATVAVITAGVLTMVQRSANAYQASAHPELGPAPQGMAGRYTWGEVVALIIGVILTLLLIAADLAP